MLSVGETIHAYLINAVLSITRNCTGIILCTINSAMAIQPLPSKQYANGLECGRLVRHRGEISQPHVSGDVKASDDTGWQSG